MWKCIEEEVTVSGTGVFPGWANRECTTRSPLVPRGRYRLPHPAAFHGCQWRSFWSERWRGPHQAQYSGMGPALELWLELSVQSHGKSCQPASWAVTLLSPGLGHLWGFGPADNLNDCSVQVEACHRVTSWAPQTVARVGRKPVSHLLTFHDHEADVGTRSVCGDSQIDLACSLTDLRDSLSWY